MILNSKTEFAHFLNKVFRGGFDSQFETSVLQNYLQHLEWLQTPLQVALHSLYQYVCICVYVYGS
eukprot:Pgem_evm1s3319